jgi:hypothetical protein
MKSTRIPKPGENHELIEQLLRQLQQSEELMGQLRAQMASAASWRAQILERLKHVIPVAEIASRRGVTPAAVYAAVQGVSPQSHEAEPQQLPGGSWVTVCPICGAVGVGGTLASRELAQQLADFHNALLTPGAAGELWNQKEMLR